MGQVTIYLADEIESKMKKAAKTYQKIMDDNEI